MTRFREGGRHSMPATEEDRFHVDWKIRTPAGRRADSRRRRLMIVAVVLAILVVPSPVMLGIRAAAGDSIVPHSRKPLRVDGDGDYDGDPAPTVTVTVHR